MKIVSSILNLIMSQEVTSAEELNRKDPSDAEKILAQYEQRLKDNEEVFKKVDEDSKKYV